MQKKSIIIYVTAIVLVVAVCFTSVFFVMKKNSKGLRRTHKPTAQTSESVENTDDSTEMLAVEASLDSMNTTQPAPDISQDYIYNGNGTLELIYTTRNADKLFYYCGDQLATAGMQVVAKYSDGGCQYVTNSVDVLHPDMYTPGYKTVTLKYTDGKGTMKSTSYSIYIEEPSVQLNYSEITLDVGKSWTVRASVSPENCYVTWASSANKVASVSGSGTVCDITGNGYGSVTITASITYNGRTYSDSCVVSVSYADSTIDIYDAYWYDYSYYNNTMYFYLSGTVQSNYDLDWVSVQLSGPQNVNGIIQDIDLYFSFDDSYLNGNTFDLDQGEYYFKVLPGYQYTLYVFATDIYGGSTSVSTTLVAAPDPNTTTTYYYYQGY